MPVLLFLLLLCSGGGIFLLISDLRFCSVMSEWPLLDGGQEEGRTIAEPKMSKNDSFSLENIRKTSKMSENKVKKRVSKKTTRHDILLYALKCYAIANTANQHPPYSDLLL